MKQGSGLTVFPGVAIGSAVVYRKAQTAAVTACGTPAAEQQKFEAACQTAKKQLAALFEQAKQTLGEEHAAILEVQMLMLEDLDYLEAVADAIAGGESAASAAAAGGVAQTRGVRASHLCLR